MTEVAGPAEGTEHQAVRALIGSTGYFIVKFKVDDCVCAIPTKMVIEPPAGTLSIGDGCIVRWSDGCRYETTVLKWTKDYATAKRYEREALEEDEQTESTSSELKSPPQKKVKNSQKKESTEKRTSTKKPQPPK